MLQRFVDRARAIYGNEFIPLHRPVFEGAEREYLVDCIDSNFVSSVGKRVTEFERLVADYTGSKHAVAVVNGTAALEISLKIVGVTENTDVITQDLTFVATANAISHLRANPIFLDVELDTLGLCPNRLEDFLRTYGEKQDGICWNKHTNRKIAACVPMHTFGNMCRITKVLEICRTWGIPVVEDAAEALGSSWATAHAGRFGNVGIISFNGNKIITTGGGGILITNDTKLAERAKHITTTAKVPHAYEFVHDEVAYNYRMPNINAALGCAQLEKLSSHLRAKAKIFKIWKEFCIENKLHIVEPIANSTSNHWLNAMQLGSKQQRDDFLDFTNSNGVMTRPVWQLMSRLDIYKSCLTGDLTNSRYLADTVVNLPSSVPDGWLNQEGDQWL